MAILNVAQMGRPVLRDKAEPVPVDYITSETVQGFIDDMVVTMREYSGVGLAAPQVHESAQIITLEAEGSPRYPEMPGIPLTVIVNPKIVGFSDDMEEDWEGCLSLTDLWGKVKRARSITITGFDRNAEPLNIEAEGFFARVLQHEIDHLYGKLFVDRMTDLKSLSFGKERMRFAGADTEKAEAI